MLRITGVDLSNTSFENDFKSLPDEVRASATQRIALLMSNPKAGALRLHKLDGYRPGIFTIDLESGKGQRYKAAFRLDGSVAYFLRADTHKKIDRYFP